MESLPFEIIDIISRELSSVIEVINLKLTCKYTYNIITLHGGKNESTREAFLRMRKIKIDYATIDIDEFSYSFVEQNMDKNWNPTKMSRYRFLTNELVRYNPNFPWKYSLVWSNSNISIKYAYQLYLEHRNDRKFYHPSITSEFVLTHNNDLFDWELLTLNMNPNFILNHRYLPWVYDLLIQNPNIKLSHILANHDINWIFENTINEEIAKYFLDNYSESINKCKATSYVYRIAYSYKPELIIDRLNTIIINKYVLENKLFFLEHINNIPWKFSLISKEIDNNNFYIVKLHSNKSWDWKILSLNMDWDIIITNLDLPWNWHCVSANRFVTLDIIRENSNLPWSIKGLSLNPNITEQFVMSRMDIFRPYVKYLSLNESISLKFINNHSKLRWDNTGLSLRSDANIDNFFKYRNIKWNKEKMSNTIIEKQNERYSLIFKELGKPDIIQLSELFE